MPELPEVETVRRGLEPSMRGARIVKVVCRRDRLRFPFPDAFAQKLENRTIEALGRRAKYLLVDLDDGCVLIMHLGMSGSFRVEAETVIAPGNFHHERSTDRTHDHVVFYLSNGVRIVYNDPRRFGFMDLTTRLEIDQHASFRNMGAEPLGNAFGPEQLAQACADKRTSLKAALLDQRVVAGLGNIYVCEALHRAGLSPDRSAGTLAKQSGAPTESARRLHEAIRDVLTEALAAGGSTLRDHRLTDGSLGYFQHTFRVYDREGEPCPRASCKGRVERRVQSGRSTFFCKSCQR